MPQDWFDSLPKEDEKKEDFFDSLPKEDRGQFGLGTATSIGPAKPPKFFSKEGAKQYGGAVIKGVGKLAVGLTELGPALARGAMEVEQNLQDKGLKPLSVSGFDVVRGVSEEMAEPLVKGYAESWKQMVKSPGKFILEQPDAFVGNVLDVLTLGAAGYTKLSRISAARKLLAGKELSGAAIKAVLKPIAVEVKNAEVESMLGKIPDDIRVKFPQQEAGAIYGEGGSIIGQESLPVTKPRVPPVGMEMKNISPVPPGAEFDRNVWEMLPREPKPTTPVSKIKTEVLVKPEAAKVAAKEPWQMTKDEFVADSGEWRSMNSEMESLQNKESNIIWTKDKNGFAVQRKKLSPAEQEKYTELRTKIVDLNSRREASLGPVNDRTMKHYDVVEKAISEGKPVPPEVLADYPDLAPKATPKPLDITRDQMKMGLEEFDADIIESQGLTRTPTPKKTKVLKVPDEIPAEAVLNESHAEALRNATPEQPLKMVYTAGGDLRETLSGLSAPAVKAFEGMKLGFHSPDVLFNRSPAGKAIYDSLNASDLAKSKFLVREAKKLGEMSKDIPEGSLVSSGVFKAKDTGFTIPEILGMGDEAIKHGFTKDELIDLRRWAPQAEKFRGFLSENFDYLIRQFGSSRVSVETEKKLWNWASANKSHPIDKKLISALTDTEREVFELYGRKIKDYIPHVFDKQEMVDFIGGKLAKAQSRLAKLKDTRMAGIVKKEIEELTIAMEKAERGPGNLLYDDLPKQIRFKFFEPRAGAEGYNVDAIKAYRTYLTGIAKKIFDEPTVRMAVEKYGELPQNMRAYTKWYLRDYLGYNRGPFDDLTNGIKSLMWMKALGFNPRSAVVNWTQKINTVADSNPADSARGYAMGFTKEGKELFDRSGLMSEVPQKLWEGTPLGHQQAIDDVRNIAGFMFSKVEAGNKKHAFLTGYYEAARKGMSEAEAMAKGIAKADKTQFRYGRVNMPRALRGPTGVVFQFWSYPIKQLEFLGKLWKENPAKFFAWMAISEGANKSTQDFLATDLSSALGVGVNWGQLFTLVDNIANGADAKQILYQMKKVPSGGGIFPYGLGPGIQAGQETVKLATDLLGGAGVDLHEALKPVTPVFLSRTAQTYNALKEGPDKEGKYTVKSTITGRPTYKESKTDILKRMFIGKPMVETKTQLDTKLRAFEQKSYNDLVTEISDLYADGKVKEAFELAAKYKIRPTKESIKAAMERKAMSSTERAKSKKPSKARIQYEQHLREGK